MYVIGHAGFVSDYLKLYHAIRKRNSRVVPRTHLLLIAEQNRVACLEVRVCTRFPQDFQLDLRRRNLISEVETCLGHRVEDRRLDERAVETVTKYRFEKIH